MLGLKGARVGIESPLKKAVFALKENKCLGVRIILSCACSCLSVRTQYIEQKTVAKSIDASPVETHASKSFALCTLKKQHLVSRFSAIRIFGFLVKMSANSSSTSTMC